jgi:hypothetical protein
MSRLPSQSEELTRDQDRVAARRDRSVKVSSQQAQPISKWNVNVLVENHGLGLFSRMQSVRSGRWHGKIVHVDSLGLSVDSWQARCSFFLLAKFATISKLKT